MVASDDLVMFGGCASGGGTGGLCPSQDGWWFRDGSWTAMDVRVWPESMQCLHAREGCLTHTHSLIRHVILVPRPDPF